MPLGIALSRDPNPCPKNPSNRSPAKTHLCRASIPLILGNYLLLISAFSKTKGLKDCAQSRHRPLRPPWQCVLGYEMLEITHTPRASQKQAEVISEFCFYSRPQTNRGIKQLLHPCLVSNSHGFVFR